MSRGKVGADDISFYTGPFTQRRSRFCGFSTILNFGALGLDRTAFNGSAILTYTYSGAGTTPSDVPEPASAALLGFGAMAIAFIRRRTGHQKACFI